MPRKHKQTKMELTKHQYKQWVDSFHKGMAVDAFDVEPSSRQLLRQQGKIQSWLQAELIAVSPDKVKIHFRGWSDDWDAEIPRQEYKNRLMPLYTETSKEQDPHDSSCSVCGGGGEMLLCDGCVRVFHLKCLKLRKFPSSDLWFCHKCKEAGKHREAADGNVSKTDGVAIQQQEEEQKEEEKPEEEKKEQEQEHDENSSSSIKQSSNAQSSSVVRKPAVKAKATKTPSPAKKKAKPRTSKSAIVRHEVSDDDNNDDKAEANTSSPPPLETGQKVSATSLFRSSSKAGTETVSPAPSSSSSNPPAARSSTSVSPSKGKSPICSPLLSKSAEDEDKENHKENHRGVKRGREEDSNVDKQPAKKKAGTPLLAIAAAPTSKSKATQPAAAPAQKSTAPVPVSKAGSSSQATNKIPVVNGANEKPLVNVSSVGPSFASLADSYRYLYECHNKGVQRTEQLLHGLHTFSFPSVCFGPQSFNAMLQLCQQLDAHKDKPMINISAIADHPHPTPYHWQQLLDSVVAFQEFFLSELETELQRSSVESQEADKEAREEEKQWQAQQAENEKKSHTIINELAAIAAEMATKKAELERLQREVKGLEAKEKEARAYEEKHLREVEQQGKQREQQKTILNDKKKTQRGRKHLLTILKLHVEKDHQQADTHGAGHHSSGTLDSTTASAVSPLPLPWQPLADVKKKLDTSQRAAALFKAMDVVTEKEEGQENTAEPTTVHTHEEEEHQESKEEVVVVESPDTASNDQAEVADPLLSTEFADEDSDVQYCAPDDTEAAPLTVSDDSFQVSHADLESLPCLEEQNEQGAEQPAQDMETDKQE